MTTYKVVAFGDDYSFRAEVGPIDPERWGDEDQGFTEGFAFGMTAEASASTRFGSTDQAEAEVEVSMGAIGAHDITIGKQRLLSYKTAIAIAEQVSVLLKLEAGAFTFERAAATFDGMTFEKDFLPGRTS